MDTESPRAVIEEMSRKFGDVAEKVEKATAAKRDILREAHRAEQRAIAEDERRGTSQEVLDGHKADVDQDDPREWCVNQERVDTIRARVTMSTLLDAYRTKDWSVAGTVQHLWFPDDDIRRVHIREGNPPADVDRPAHLRGVNLVMDYKTAPEPLQHLIKETAKALNRKNRKSLIGNNPLRSAIQTNARIARALRGKLGIPHA